MKDNIPKYFFYLPLLMLFSLLIGCKGQEDSPDEDLAAIAVTTDKVSYSKFISEYKAYGSILSNYTPSVAAQTAGKVLTLNKKIGESVSKGEVIAELEDTLAKINLAKAKANFTATEARIDNQYATINRLKQLKSSNSYSQSGLDEALTKLEELGSQLIFNEQAIKEAQYHLDKTKVLAPIDGRIQERFLAVGDFVNIGVPIYKIVANEQLKAEISIPQNLLPSLDNNITITLDTPTSKQKIITSQYNITPMVDIANRSIKLVTAINNPGNWYPGASTNANIKIKEWQALSVNKSSISNINSKHYVYLVNEDSTVTEQEVKLGMSYLDRYEITAGVKEGQEIVLEGTSLISDKAKIKLKNS